MTRWPNLFIAGAPKAGTFSLYEYLKMSNQIFMAPIKEPHYFNHISVPENKPVILKPIRDKKKYLSLFESASDKKFLGDATPMYLSDPEAPHLIKQASPEASIIISLRDPVEREFSIYKMLMHRKDIRNPFLEEIKYQLTNVDDFRFPALRLSIGLYYDDVKRFIEIFGKSKVKIIIFEEWTKKVHSTMEEIFKFLQLNEKLESVNYKQYNKYEKRSIPRGSIGQYLLTKGKYTTIMKKLSTQSTWRYIEKNILMKEINPKMTKDEKNILVNYYQKDVKNLEKLLNIKLPWINFKMA